MTGACVWHFGKTMGPRGARSAHIGVTVAFMLPATIYVYPQRGT
ncbi:MAG: hypothetical protein U0992_00220 [Planctomycetaceae bacterium]